MARVYVSIGSNVDRRNNIGSALRALARAFGTLQASQIYETPAEGFNGDPFYNLVVAFRTELPPLDLAATLKSIEDGQGRRRDVPKFSARTLDLDLLLYDDLILAQPGLNLPRDEIERYAFVLGPLAEIASSRSHPVSGQTYGSLWRQMKPTAQLRPVATVRDLDPKIPLEDIA